MNIKTYIYLILLIAIAYLLNGCKRAGCNEEGPIYKHLKIPDWAKEKYAYRGNETLVFYEINGTDTAELTFTPLNNLDTTIESISWYEASNGDWCRGSQTDIDARIDQYYCKERDWYFLAAQNAEDKRIKIEFHQKYNTSYNYNFYVWVNPELINSKWSDKPRQALLYIGDTTIFDTHYSELVKIRQTESTTFYYSPLGYIEWRFYERNYKIQLKNLIR